MLVRTDVNLMVKVICDKCKTERPAKEAANWPSVAIANKHAADLCPTYTEKLCKFLVKE